MDLGVDLFEYRGQVVRNFRIPEANDAIPLLFKPELPLLIFFNVLVFGVMSTVDFDD